MTEPPDAFIQGFLDSRSAEAINWLKDAPNGSARNLGEMSPEESMTVVEKLYWVGAKRVLAVQVEDIPGGEDQTTNHLLVQTPEELALRHSLFECIAQFTIEQGFDPDKDKGQPYLYMGLC